MIFHSWYSGCAVVSKITEVSSNLAGWANTDMLSEDNTMTLGK